MILQVVLCSFLVFDCQAREECGAPAFSRQLLQVGQATKASEDGFNMCIVRDDQCFDLYMDPAWDDGVTQNQAQHLNLAAAQLVVARYDEDLRWLDALPQVPAVVYNRGGNEAGVMPRPRANLQMVQQVNDGREDQVFLKHIYANYHNLSEATVFLQGWPFGHCPGFLRAVRRAITAVLAWELAGPTTAGYIQGLAPVTSTFWQYHVESGRIGLAAQMARRKLPPQQHATAQAEAREAYKQMCRQILRRPCPSHQWVAEGAQWAVSRARVQSTPRDVYGRAMSFGEGWEGKFRGLVLEALWPMMFGAAQWEPTQVDYLPLLAASANNRARSNDDYCELHPSSTDQKEKSRHLIFSCASRVDLCERQRHHGKIQSGSFEADRLHYQIYDSTGFLPWHFAATLKPVLFGSSQWFPRNSPEGMHVSRAVADTGYAPKVLEVDGLLQLPLGKDNRQPVRWVISDEGEAFRFSRTNEKQETHHLGCVNDLAVLQKEPSSWQLKQAMNGWVRLWNLQEKKWLSLDDRSDGGNLHCLKEVRYDYEDSTDHSMFLLEALRLEDGPRT